MGQKIGSRLLCALKQSADLDIVENPSVICTRPIRLSA